MNDWWFHDRILNGGSLVWMMADTFNLLWEAIPCDSKGKIGTLQSFCFLYNILLRNLQNDEEYFRNVTNQENIFEGGSQKIRFTRPNSNSDYLLCMTIMDYIREKLGKFKTNTSKESIDFIKKFSKWDKNMSLMAGKMMILEKTMCELDNCDFETEMEDEFFILKRETCLKIINCLRIYNEKELDDRYRVKETRKYEEVDRERYY